MLVERGCRWGEVEARSATALVSTCRVSRSFRVKFATMTQV